MKRGERCAEKNVMIKELKISTDDPVSEVLNAIQTEAEEGNLLFK